MEIKHLILKIISWGKTVMVAISIPALAIDESQPGSIPEILSYGTIEDSPFLPDFSYAGYRNGNQSLPGLLKLWGQSEITRIFRTVG